MPCSLAHSSIKSCGGICLEGWDAGKSEAVHGRAVSLFLNLEQRDFLMCCFS